MAIVSYCEPEAIRRALVSIFRNSLPKCRSNWNAFWIWAPRVYTDHRFNRELLGELLCQSTILLKRAQDCMPRFQRRHPTGKLDPLFQSGIIHVFAQAASRNVAVPTILAKMCGTKCLFPELLQFSLAPPFPSWCNVGRLVGKPFLTNNIAWGEGGKVGFIPKNVSFHVKNWSMVEAVHSASLSHIILARIVWMWRLNIKVRVTSILTNVWMSNLTWLMFVTFCICSIQMWLFEEKFKRFTELHERILGYGARFGRTEIWSK